tara:strand:+ start:51 stop:932 length:882 start_codon:yes stop_codon:yes gene_type:complete
MTTQNNDSVVIDLSNLDETTNTDTNIIVNDNNNVQSFQKDALFYEVYRTLETLVQGTEYNEGNWILLLTKTMTLVNELKQISRDDRITLTSELVFHYLEENSTLQPLVFQEIKLSIFSLIESFLLGRGSNKKQHIKNKKTKVSHLMKKDTDVVVSPLQITNILVRRIVTTIKEKNITASSLKHELPSIILLSITLLDKYRHLTGNEKKNLIIQALSNVVNQHIIEGKLIDFTEDEKSSLNFLLAELPVLIDTLVGVANGKTDFNFNFDNPESILQCITKVYTLVSPFFGRCKK